MFQLGERCPYFWSWVYLNDDTCEGGLYGNCRNIHNYVRIELRLNSVFYSNLDNSIVKAMKTFNNTVNLKCRCFSFHCRIINVAHIEMVHRPFCLDYPLSLIHI